MAISDAILDAYVTAETIEQAEHELDRLATRPDELPASLGDLYDELAEAAAQEDTYDIAARLERKALEAGCRQPVVAREMLGWYLLKSGAVTEGEAVFAELCRERQDDSSLRVTRGHARSDAGLQEAAFDAFDEALAVAKRHGFEREIDRARISRRAEREHFGVALDEDDRLAPPPRPGAGGPVAWSLAWFPPEERRAAVTRRRLRRRTGVFAAHRGTSAATQPCPRTAPVRSSDRGSGARRLGSFGGIRPRHRRGALRLRCRARAQRPHARLAAGPQRPMLVPVGSQVQALLRRRMSRFALLHPPTFRRR